MAVAVMPNLAPSSAWERHFSSLAFFILPPILTYIDNAPLFQSGLSRMACPETEGFRFNSRSLYSMNFHFSLLRLYARRQASLKKRDPVPYGSGLLYYLLKQSNHIYNKIKKKSGVNGIVDQGNLDLVLLENKSGSNRPD